MTKPGDPAGPSAVGSLRDWFERALDVDPGERDAWLQRAIGDASLRERVRRLLDAEGRSDAMLDSTAGNAVRQLDGGGADAAGMIGSSIGPFRLVSLLGEGGSSMVFRAERRIGDGTQTVALKLLRTGLYSADAQRRFRREQRLLAELTHPNLTSLVDGGISEAGVPYIAMEYVDGLPITEFCDSRALGIEERLRLAIVVCRAVDSAHRALVVHRDLKPSNVLVDRNGHVEVLDFGIAKLLGESHDATRTEYIALTPGYAAPEQYRSDPVTTAADVYALGVLVGELLTGMRLSEHRRRGALEPELKLPSQRVEASAAQRDVPPGLPQPSTLARRLRGDLDAILSTALATDPHRRYDSAGRLADDIERFLDGKPVRAHAPSRRYRWGKGIQRHRTALVLGGIAAIAAFAGVATALWQANQARELAQRALVSRNFLSELMVAAKAELPRDQRPTPDILVRAAATRLESRDDLAPEIRMELLQTLGEVGVANGDYAEAEALYDRAMAIGRERYSAGDTALLQLQLLRADLLLRVNRYREASLGYEEVLPWIRQADAPAKVRALLNYPASLMYSGRTAEALRFAEEAADSAADFYGEDSAKGIAARLMPGTMLVAAGRHADAAALLEAGLANWRQRSLPLDAAYLQAVRSLASARESLGQLQAAEELHRELVATSRRIYEEPHDRIAIALHDLGEVLLQQDRLDEAAGPIELALAMFEAVFGRGHMRVSLALQSRSVLHLRNRDLALAERDAREALTWCTRPELHPTRTCVQAWTRMGEVLLAVGRLDEADDALDRALGMAAVIFPEGHPYIGEAVRLRAEVQARRGSLDAAIARFNESLAMFERLQLTSGEGATMARYGRASALAALGRHQAALADVEAALASWQRLAPEGHLRRIEMLGTKARLLASLDRRAEARGVAREALALVQAHPRLPPLAVSTLEALAALPGDG